MPPIIEDSTNVPNSYASAAEQDDGARLRSSSNSGRDLALLKSSVPNPAARLSQQPQKYAAPLPNPNSISRPRPPDLKIKLRAEKFKMGEPGELKYKPTPINPALRVVSQPSLENQPLVAPPAPHVLQATRSDGEGRNFLKALPFLPEEPLHEDSLETDIAPSIEKARSLGAVEIKALAVDSPVCEESGEKIDTFEEKCIGESGENCLTGAQNSEPVSEESHSTAANGASSAQKSPPESNQSSGLIIHFCERFEDRKLRFSGLREFFDVKFNRGEKLTPEELRQLIEGSGSKPSGPGELPRAALRTAMTQLTEMQMVAKNIACFVEDEQEVQKILEDATALLKKNIHGISFLQWAAGTHKEADRKLEGFSKEESNRFYTDMKAALGEIEELMKRLLPIAVAARGMLTPDVLQNLEKATARSLKAPSVNPPQQPKTRFQRLRSAIASFFSRLWRAISANASNEIRPA